jgi:hypothetical protein
MAAAIVTRIMNIAAQAATMVAEFIEAVRSSEAALLCEAEPQCVGGARMLPIIALDAVRTLLIVEGDADDKHN